VTKLSLNLFPLLLGSPLIAEVLPLVLLDIPIVLGVIRRENVRSVVPGNEVEVRGRCRGGSRAK
jgi:hypothetical protein